MDLLIIINLLLLTGHSYYVASELRMRHPWQAIVRTSGKFSCAACSTTIEGTLSANDNIPILVKFCRPTNCLFSQDMPMIFASKHVYKRLLWRHQVTVWRNLCISSACVSGSNAIKAKNWHLTTITLCFIEKSKQVMVGLWTIIRVSVLVCMS